VKCNRKKLYERLVALEKIVDRDSVMRILGCVKLEAKSDGLLLARTTDLNRSLTAWMEVDGEISACVDIDKLVKAVNPDAVDDSEIELLISDGRLKVVADGLKINLTLYPVEDFPVDGPSIGWNPAGTWKTSELAKAIAFTLPAASVDTTRPNLTQAAFSTALSTTDGKRLHIMPLSVPASIPFKLPTQSLQSLSCLLRHGEDAMAFVHEEKKSVIFRIGDFEFECKDNGVEFPPVEQAIVAKQEAPVSVNATRLKKALKRLISLQEDPAHRVRLGINEDIRIAFNDCDGNECSVQVDLVTKPVTERAPFGVNANYLVEALIGLGDTDEVELTSREPLDPIRVDAADGRIAIVMPMRM
jgi:DNA polymerase III sliding clamp (beta) subunit (PCNA family)